MPKLKYIFYQIIIVVFVSAACLVITVPWFMYTGLFYHEAHDMLDFDGREQIIFFMSLITFIIYWIIFFIFKRRTILNISSLESIISFFLFAILTPIIIYTMFFLTSYFWQQIMIKINKERISDGALVCYVSNIKEQSFTDKTLGITVVRPDNWRWTGQSYDNALMCNSKLYRSYKLSFGGMHNDALAIYIKKDSSYGRENYLDIMIDNIKRNEQDVKIYYNFLNNLLYKNVLIVSKNILNVYIQNKCGDLLVINLMPYSKGLGGYWISDPFKATAVADRYEWIEKNKMEFLNILDNIKIIDSQCE